MATRISRAGAVHERMETRRLGARPASSGIKSREMRAAAGGCRRRESDASRKSGVAPTTLNRRRRRLRSSSSKSAAGADRRRGTSCAPLESSNMANADRAFC